MTRPARVALVTGAARGIGAATVDALCAQGYRVLAFDSCAGDEVPVGVRGSLADRAELEAVAARHPGQVLAHVGDVRDPAALRAAAASAVATFGGLDVVVAAAGVIGGGRPLWETSADEFASQWEVNALGVWNTAHAVVPHLLAQPDPAGCRFVAVASAAGERGMFGLSAYAASKHAVIGIVRGLAADLVGTGVTAVAVAPGATETAMLQATAELYQLDDVGELVANQLIRRAITPAEQAAVIALCCSPAGAALNGSVLRADGGFVG
ncbi:mycofactocin-coupled SDR family oxidoreductase [Nocardioides sp. Bht2]|uniref:mycofactocin-coupled SDR family oxidoreductase n=1 Tax=Nocardioides sp. Bht2 TaxID=3392297 RepID=UPI0039B41C2E